MIRALKTAATLSLLALSLTACATVPSMGNQPQVPAQWQSEAPRSTQIALSPWWQGFKNAELNSWVEKARAHNNDLKAAEANLKAARALLAQARTASQPVGSVDASLQRMRQSSGAQPPGVVGSTPFEDQTLADTGFSLGWELDLSGRFSGLRDEAHAGEDNALWRKRQVEAAITAETVHAWLNWRAAQMDDILIQQRLSALDELYRAQQKAHQIGGIPADAVEIARAEVESLRAEQPLVAARLRQAARRLAVLTGDLPQAAPQLDPRDQTEDWAAPDALPRLDPTESLRRRPDVGMAEAQVRAALAQAKINRADLYPRITLVGTAGLTNAPADLNADNSLRFSAGPQLSWGLFNYNRTRARIRAADAQADAAYAQWHQTTLSALEESENAIDGWVSTASSESTARQALEASRNLSRHALQRFNHGLISRADLLRAEERRLDTERRVAQAHLETALSWSRACLALGGGWTTEDRQ